MYLMEKNTPWLATRKPLLFLVTFVIANALRGNFEKHKKITRWLWPMWLYVSVTGVLVYFMLYQWWPPVS